MHSSEGIMKSVLICAMTAAMLLTGCGQKATWTEGVTAAGEREARPQELIAHPRDGESVGVNPPGFTWTPFDGAKSYRLELRRAGGAAVLSTEPQTSTVYAHNRTLESGDYEWKIVYLGPEGKMLGISKTRRFSLPAGVPALPMPDIARLKSQLSGVRPRLFLNGNRLPEIKAAVGAGGVKWWKPFLEAADGALEEPLYPEPEGYPSAEFDVEHWRRIYTPGKLGSAHLVRTALAYRITGESKYLDASRRWMLNLAGWNPQGSTSHAVPQPNGSEGNDEASMPMLDRMSLAWDWIGDKLTVEERARVIASMTERGNQVLALLKEQDFLSHPFSNHEGRVLAFLGNAGLSFLGDIPDAEKWLDYVLRCYLTSYPAWGGDEGGWAQGMGYWSAYVYYLTSFAEALRGVTDVDLFRRPFYRNTGYLPVYFQPPYAPRGAFGDGGDRGPGESQQILVERFADAFDDPVLRWHAQSIPVAAPTREKNQWREWLVEDAGAILRAKPASLKSEAKPPAELDGSRHLTDIGWAAMHSALGDAENDVWVLFKSSRFGSFSHSHADQNTFQVNAYGRPLLIDSGYYPWYGSAHDGLWTRQTRAHNGILVNGRGQPPHSWAAGGRIEAFERHGIVTLARGQAAEAYNFPQTQGILRMWQKSLKEPPPPMSPRVETFERTVAFVGSKSRPVIVVHDYLKTDGPATYDYLLHAMNRMRADARSGSIAVSDGGARLAIRLASSQPLAISQTDRFAVAPEIEQSSGCAANPKDCAARFPNQWHLSARTQGKAGEVRFLAVMAPYRVSEQEPEIVPVKSGDALGFRVAGTQVAAWWGAGPRGKISAGALSGDGRLVIRVEEGGKTSQVVSQ
jgi:hypothetical protein